eukprot:11220895-Alexandrium_andersonii.AAC.2
MRADPPEAIAPRSHLQQQGLRLTKMEAPASAPPCGRCDWCGGRCEVFRRLQSLRVCRACRGLLKMATRGWIMNARVSARPH